MRRQNAWRIENRGFADAPRDGLERKRKRKTDLLFFKLLTIAADLKSSIRAHFFPGSIKV